MADNKKRPSRNAGQPRPHPLFANTGSAEVTSALHPEKPRRDPSICINSKCKLRKEAGNCSGFEGCPGFKMRG